MKVKITITFEYHFSGDKLSEGANGELISHITSFYSNLKGCYYLKNLKVTLEEVEE